MSTPSDTIRTATIQRSWLSANRLIFRLPWGSSLSTTTGFRRVMACRVSAYARALAWSEAMTSPAASGIWLRTSVSRVSAADSTAGIQDP